MKSISWRDWTIMNGLKKGVTVIPMSISNLLKKANTKSAAPTIMTITEVEVNSENLADSQVTLRVYPKWANKRHRTVRAWWVLENTYVVEREDAAMRLAEMGLRSKDIRYALGGKRVA